MVKIHASPVSRDARLEAETTLIEPSDRLARSAAFRSAFETSPGPSLFRYINRHRLNEDTMNAILGEGDAPSTADAQITREQANEKYGLNGALDFTQLGAGPMITERHAAELSAIKQREMARQAILSENTSLGPVGEFGAAAAGTFADPLTLATAFIPVGWIGRSAMLARGGAASRAASRAAAGAAEGLAFGAATEAVVLPLAQAEGRDYTLGDSVATVFFSTVFGGALAPAVGAVGDAVAGVPGRSRRGAPRGAPARTAAPDIGPPPRDLADVPVLAEPEDVAPYLRRAAEVDQAAREAATVRPIDRKAAAIRSEAFAKAVDDIAGGDAVDVVPLMRKLGQEEGIVPPRVQVIDEAPSSASSIREATVSRGGDQPVLNARAGRARPDDAPPQRFADAAEESAAPRFGDGEIDRQIADLDTDFSDIRARLDEEIAAGRLDEEQLIAARQEVREALGVTDTPLDRDVIERAYDAARLCITGRS